MKFWFRLFFYYNLLAILNLCLKQGIHSLTVSLLRLIVRFQICHYCTDTNDKILSHVCYKNGMKISCDNLRINVFTVLRSDPCVVECFFNTVSQFSCLCVSLCLVIFQISCFTLSVSISLVCCLGLASCLLITLIMFSCF